ncbi:hypothetical protein G3480_27110, partial [Thiorhodococcus mannitoliphagus]
YTRWDESGGCQSPMERDPPWKSAAGGSVDVCAYPGEFVWVSYGAPWCTASRGQAPEVRVAARAAPPSSRFVMNLTSGGEPFQPATLGQARAWASQYGFDPAMVTTEGHSVRTIPQHALIGPDGRTWFRYIGYLTAEEILARLRAYQAGEIKPKRFD